MPKPSPVPRIIEKSSNCHASLEAAQAAALGEVAQAIASLMRQRLGKGELTVVNKQVKLAEEEQKECKNE